MQSLDEPLADAQALDMAKPCCAPATVAGFGDVLSSLVEHREEFVAFATRQLGDRASAEELVQASFVKAAERIEQLESADSGRAWFYRMLRNGALDIRRRRGVHERAVVAFSAEQERSIDPQERTQRVCRCVSRALTSLKPEYEVALRQVEIEGAAVKDFASQQGILANNGAVRIFRAREALKKKVEAICGSCADGGCLDCTCDEPS